MVRLLPALPALPSQPPLLLGATLPRGRHGRHHEGIQTFSPMSWATPCLAKDSPRVPITIGVIFLKENKIKGGWWRNRAGMLCADGMRVSGSHGTTQGPGQHLPTT